LPFLFLARRENVNADLIEKNNGST
jgi:hypothetical protein